MDCAIPKEFDIVMTFAYGFAIPMGFDFVMTFAYGLCHPKVI